MRGRKRKSKRVWRANVSVAGVCVLVLWDLFAIRFKYSLTQHSRLMIIIYFIWKCSTPKRYTQTTAHTTYAEMFAGSPQMYNHTSSLKFPSSLILCFSLALSLHPCISFAHNWNVVAITETNRQMKANAMDSKRKREKGRERCMHRATDTMVPRIVVMWRFHFSFFFKFALVCSVFSWTCLFMRVDTHIVALAVRRNHGNVR